jgi:hypothetical protein
VTPIASVSEAAATAMASERRRAGTSLVIEISCG